MALSRIWVSMICVALAFGAASGRGAQLGAAAAQGVQQAVDFCLTVGGMICLWSGVMELMRRCGIAGGLSRLLRPVLRRLFPHAARDVQALDALSMNVSANLLGLGNAATPAGVRAAQAMARELRGDTASDELCLLVVLNTASIQLLPVTIAAVREAAAVAAHLHEAGKAWGIDGDRLAFAGDSGGAHLGLAATLYLREEMGGADFVKCLLLFYGWFGLTDSSSMRLLGGPWDGLTEEDWQFYLNLYAEDPAALAAEPYANLFLNDLTHDVPACYIAAAEFDPLRDDSATLAAICEQYGTPFRFELFEGVIHAFLHYTKMLDAANDVLEHGATFYRETLGLA